jgi:hypothetical protein
LEACFDDHRLFKVKRGVANCVFGHLWNSGDAFDLHGSAADQMRRHGFKDGQKHNS